MGKPWTYWNTTGADRTHDGLTIPKGESHPFETACALVKWVNGTGTAITENHPGAVVNGINAAADKENCGEHVKGASAASNDSPGEESPIGPGQSDDPERQGAPNPESVAVIDSAPETPGDPEDSRQPTEAAHDPAHPQTLGELQDRVISQGADPETAQAIAERARKGYPPAGEEDASHGGDRTNDAVTGADPVELFSGFLTESAVDLDVPTPFFPLRLERVYRSGNPHFGPFGFNWDHSWNVYLRPLSDGRIGRWNGRLHEDVFTSSGSGYEPPRGVFERLERLPGMVDSYRVSARGGFRLDFERPLAWSDAERIPLVRISDRAGNTVWLRYDQANRIQEVADDDGRALRFEYGNCGLLERVLDHTGRTVRYDHDDIAEHLACVVQPEEGDERNATTVYEYDTRADHPAQRHNLLRILDGHGNQLLETTFGADPSQWSWNRVVRQRMGGHTWLLDYRQLQWLAPLDEFVNDPMWQTTLRGPDGCLRTFSFNFRGDLLDERYRLVRDRSYRMVTTTQKFDAQGNAIELTRPDGSRMGLRYDDHAINPCDRGNLLRVELRASPIAAIASRIVYRATYDPRFQIPTEEIDETGATVQYTYDQHPAGFGALERIDWPDCSLPDGTPQLASTRYETNPRGQMEALITPEGIRNEVHYESPGSTLAGFPIEITQDALVNAEKTHFGYSSLGRQNKVTDGLGRVTTIEHDLQGRILAIDAPATDGQVARWEWTYGYHGQVIEARRPRGELTDPVLEGPFIRDRFDRDPLGYLTGTTIGANTALPRTTRIGKDYAGRPLRQVDAAGRITRWCYDERGLVLSEEHASGTTAEQHLSKVYDKNGRLEIMHLPGGATVECRYDPWGRASVEIEPDGTEVHYRYGPADHLREVEVVGDPGDGQGTRRLSRRRAAYDEGGRPVRSWVDVFEADPDQARELQTVTWYDRDGRRTRHQNPRGESTTSAYDGLSRPIRVTDAVGNTIENVYGPAGSTLRTIFHDSTPTGQATTWIERRFDACGRLHEVDTSAGTSVRQKFDARGLVVRTIDENGIEVHRQYGLLGERTSMVVDPGGLALSHQVDHDVSGLEVSYTDPTGAVATITRDAAGRETRTELPGGYWVSSEYGPDGRVSRSTRSDGTVIDLSRDPAGRVTHMSANPGMGLAAVPMHTLHYDGLGRRVRATAGSSDISWRFDSVGRVIQETSPLGTSRREFDELSAAVDTFWPNGRAERHRWDAIGRVTSLELLSPSPDLPSGSNGDLLARLSYHGALRVADIQYGTGAATRYRYDDLGRVVGIDHLDAAGAVISDTSTAHDAAGRRRLETTNGLGAEGRFYSYRSSGELEAWAAGIAASVGRHRKQAAQDAEVAAAAPLVPTATETVTYSLNSSGARLTRSHSAGGVTTYSRGPSQRLDAINGAPNEHDVSGRRKKDNRFEYAYDCLGRVVKIDAAGAPVAALDYDAAGRLVSRSDPLGRITRSGYLAGLPLWDEDASGAKTIERTLHPGRINALGETRRDGWRSLHFNPHQDLTLVTDSGGAPVEAFRYTPFGRALMLDPQTGAVISESRIDQLPIFGAMPGIAGTGLYFTPARLYDPRTGMFCAIDPMLFVGGADPYAYGGHDPLNFLDPSGEIAPLIVFLVLIGIGSIMGGLAAWWSGGDYWDIAAGAVIGGAVGALGGWAFGAAATWATAALSHTALAGSVLTNVLGSAIGGAVSGAGAGFLSGAAHGAVQAYRTDGDLIEAAWAGGADEFWAGGVSGLITGGMFGGLSRLGTLPAAILRRGPKGRFLPSPTGWTAFIAGDARRAAMMPMVVARGLASPWGAGAPVTGFAGGYSAQVTRDLLNGADLGDALANSLDEGAESAVLGVVQGALHPITARYWQTRMSPEAAIEVEAFHRQELPEHLKNQGLQTHHQLSRALYPEHAHINPENENLLLPWTRRITAVSNPFSRGNVSGEYSILNRGDHEAAHAIWGIGTTKSHGPFVPAWAATYLPSIQSSSSDGSAKSKSSTE